MPRKKTKRKYTKRKTAAKARPRTRTVTKTIVRRVGASKKKMARRRPRRVNGSLFGQSFNIKNYLIKSVIGGGLGLGMKYVAEYGQEKLGLVSPLQKFGLNMLLGVGTPLLFRKNKKALAYLLPASFAFTGASIFEAFDEMKGDVGFLSGGTSVRGNLLYGGTQIMNGPVQVHERQAPNLNEVENF